MEIYKNSKYKVIMDGHPEGVVLYDGVAPFLDFYSVVNLATNVTEHRCPTMPEALSAAYNLEDQLINTPWVTALENQKKFQKSMLDDFESDHPETITRVTPVN